MADRRLVFEHIMEPGTGKAVPVLRGQILRIEQAGDGQCADFNAFNLHDYKEYFHCGRTRHMHGLWPKAGDMLWSAPPRERPMYTIVADPVGTNDVNYPRCTAFLYEFHYGYTMHTNCHDIQAEAQREYGLTPDDVHDSFNFWMQRSGSSSSVSSHSSASTMAVFSHVPLTIRFLPLTLSAGTVSHFPLTLISIQCVVIP